jgi:hypothetical protein
MAKYLKRYEGLEVSHVFVADPWHEHGLKPHRQDTFKLSKDPLFAEKVADIVGLYLAPPATAVVLCVDEKSGVQALDRTQPLLPLTFDKTEKRTHDYVRHGTVNLFGALEVATVKVTGECYPRRGSEEFLAFMKTVAAQYVDRDSCRGGQPGYALHRRGARLAGRQSEYHISSHAGGGVVDQPDRDLVRSDHSPSDPSRTFSSIRQLITTIENHITNWNANCKPFTWTANADAILAKVRWIESEVHRLTDTSDFRGVSRVWAGQRLLLRRRPTRHNGYWCVLGVAALFSNVTDFYRLGRLRTDLGEIYFNAVFLTGMNTAYLDTKAPWLFAAVVTLHSATAF